MEWLLDPNIWLSLVTLTVLEIVLGIDNIIFISIVAGNLPRARQPAARKLGLLAAVISRLALLGSIFLLTKLQAPLFSLFDVEISIRDLVLIAGGLFLLAKSTLEIHKNIEGEGDVAPTVAVTSYAGVVSQIMILDVVFSLDSVITAVGMAEQVWVMATAIILAVGVMLLFVDPISRFVDEHPTIKMLALAFLVLIGVALIADGINLHIPKGYIYFAMAFSVGVEMLNLRLRRKRIEYPES